MIKIFYYQEAGIIQFKYNFFFRKKIYIKQIWDKRQTNAVRRIFGPHICGDALDIDTNDVILTGSWRPSNQLELWDYGTGKLIEEFKLSKENTTKQTCNVYSCQFSNGSASYIAVGGSGANEAKILDRQSGKVFNNIF